MEEQTEVLEERKEILETIPKVLEEKPEEPKAIPKLSQTERMLRIIFYLLVIASVMLLGAWLAKLIFIAVAT